MIAGHEVTRCPMRYMGETERQRIMAYKEYTMGFLPNSGSWLAQPVKFTLMMNLIERELEKHRPKEA